RPHHHALRVPRVDSQRGLDSDLLPLSRATRAVLARGAEHSDRHCRHPQTSLQYPKTRAAGRAKNGRAEVKISIIGAGSFGTAMSIVAARCGNDVALWAHDPKIADTIVATRTNPTYLGNAAIESKVHATSDLAEAA